MSGDLLLLSIFSFSVYWLLEALWKNTPSSTVRPPTFEAFRRPQCLLSRGFVFNSFAVRRFLSRWLSCGKTPLETFRHPSAMLTALTLFYLLFQFCFLPQITFLHLIIISVDCFSDSSTPPIYDRVLLPPFPLFVLHCPNMTTRSAHNGIEHAVNVNAPYNLRGRPTRFTCKIAVISEISTQSMRRITWLDAKDTGLVFRSCNVGAATLHWLWTGSRVLQF